MTLTAAEHEVTGWAEAVEAYFERGWTDGLPVLPATAEVVQSFLDAAGRKPGDVVLREATRRCSIAQRRAIPASTPAASPTSRKHTRGRRSPWIAGSGVRRARSRCTPRKRRTTC